MTIEELQVLITANTRDLQKEIDNANKSINSLKKSADKSQKGVISAFSKLKQGIIALGIGKVIKDSIMTGINAIETDSLFETSLGKMADDVRSWSDEIGDALGLNAISMRKNVGVIYNMTTSMGLAEDNALKMSKGITLLTEDMASFYNLDSTEAFNKLRAGLTGETEPLKALGILVDENTIKQVAYSEGIASVGSELTQQEKVLARYIAILKQTGNAQGDLARTIDSPANQLRMLRNQVSQLGLAFSNFLIPILKAVLPYVIAFTKVITTALNGLAKFLGLSGSTSSSVSSTFSDIADSTGNISSGLGGVNSGLDSANNKAKKLKGQLAGFDEMNVLQDNSSDSDSSGGSSGGGGSYGSIGADGLFDLTEYDAKINGLTSKADELAQKLRDAFSGIDFTNLINSFDRLKESLKPFTESIGSGLKWLLDKVLVPIASWTIEDLLPSFLNAVAGALDFLNPIISDAMGLLSWLWDNFLQPVATWTGGVIVSTLNGIGDALSWIGQNKTAVTVIESLMLAIGTGWATFKGLSILGGIVQFIKYVGALAGTGGLLSSIGATISHIVSIFTSTKILAPLTKALGLVKGALVAVASALGISVGWVVAIIGAIAGLVVGIVALVKNWDKVKEVALNVWGKIKDIWGVVADWFNKNVVEPVKKFFSPLTEWFSKLFNSIWKSIESAFTVISGLARGCWEIIKAVWGVASSWFNTTIISPIKNFFSNMWDSLKNGASQCWAGIKSVFSPVVNWFSEKFSTAWNKVKAVFSTGGKIFDGIKEGIANVFKTVVNGIIKGINKVISIPFNTINGFLNKIRNAEFLGIAPFKDKWKQNPLSVPQIPLLARGGVVSSPTIAMIGEAGKEAVVPLENNTGWIDKLADKINSNGNDGQPIQLTVKLGEDTIYNKFIEYSRRKSFETNGEVFSL